MVHTFRSIKDSKNFFMGLIGGLVVAIVSILLELFNRIWNPENKPGPVYWIMIIVLVLILFWALSRWSYLMDAEDNLDALRLRHRK